MVAAVVEQGMVNPVIAVGAVAAGVILLPAVAKDSKAVMIRSVEEYGKTLMMREGIRHDASLSIKVLLLVALRTVWRGRFKE